ncbi:MAG: hypothetical protein QW520_01190 [Methanomassiliicoccales archaeon]
MSTKIPGPILGQRGLEILKELKNVEQSHPHLIKVVETERGFNVLFKDKDMEVELVQAYESEGGRPSLTLESRLQYITKKIYLDNGERNRVSFLLQQAKFKSISGQHGSFKLEIPEPEKDDKLDRLFLDRLEETVLEMAKIAKAARGRSWK